MKCLITGGAGFIGSNLSNRLVEEGWIVDVVDDLSAGDLKFLSTNKNGTLACNHFYKCSFSHIDIKRAIERKQYDCVFHLAALPKVSYSVEHPIETNNVNVVETLKLLEYCKGNVGKFINTSSSAVYGNNCIPSKEDHTPAPNSPYALQKLITEQYCQLYSDIYDLETVSVRPFNVFGPHQKGNSAYACAISAWFDAIKKGNDLRFDGDGTQTRDLIYVEDLVDLYIKIAQDNYKFNGTSFNAGTGESVSNNEIIAWIKNNISDVVIKNAPERVGDVKHTLADIQRSSSIFNWHPKVNFWEGIQKTWAWCKKSELF